MKEIKNLLLLTLLSVILPLQAGLAQVFEPNWASLEQYIVPDWYRDAKFGIFMHWGVSSVPAHENGWYGRQMYQQEGAEWGTTYAYHLAHYGHPSEFGYKDLIPMWKAEKWDPDALVRFYQSIGARYVVPVAVHHDNFDNYASTFQPWNSVNMGPKRDIIGEWKKACEKHGLRLGVSSHADRTWDWFSTAHGSDTHGDKKGIPYDGTLTKADGKGKWWEGYDPVDLYTAPHASTEAPDEAYCTKWYNRTIELIDQDHPDLLWFDGPMPMVCSSRACADNRTQMETYGLEVASHFYNSNQAWHGGKMEAVLNLKSWEKGDLPSTSAIVYDTEKGQTSNIRKNPWQTDTSIPGDWFFDSEALELSDTVIVHNLCDIVSKNGNLLLNVGLRADGTLPEDQKKVLSGVGKWLKINGEAIYGTRPWEKYGEGPTVLNHGDFQQNKRPFTAKDIRFTTKGNSLYAIILGWPADGKITLQSIPKDKQLWFGAIGSVRLLGCKRPLKWERNALGTTVYLPKKRPGEYAYVVKLTCQK